jgi:hypothetical protein|tara:strand:- start:219 stop:914 length:696 start_codon:yes stop_codon:yes gene_type:complete
MANHRHDAWYGTYSYDSSTNTFSLPLQTTRTSTGVVVGNEAANETHLLEEPGQVLDKVQKKVASDGTGTLELTFPSSVGDQTSSYPAGTYIAVEGVNPPSGSAYSNYNATFTDPNKAYVISSSDYTSSKTVLTVPFSTNEINNAEYTIDSSSKAYREDFRIFIYGLLTGMWNNYKTLTGRYDLPLNFKMTHDVGAYDETNKCFYESFSLCFKRNDDSVLGTINSVEATSTY